MHIGIPKEIKNHEYRVGMVPASVRELIQNGHSVVVETNAGIGIGFTDEDYTVAGATIAATASDVFQAADMIVKVKEPQAVECAMLREGQILFTYLHLAPDLPQTQALIDSKAVCIAYETVTDRNGGLPLLAPMSEVAGRMSIQAGAQALEKSNGGCGMLLGGVPGVQPAKVVVIGGGMVGNNAAQMAVGLGAEVTIFDPNANVEEVQKEYNLVSETSIPTKKFDAIVLTVAHKEFKELDLISLKKEKSIVYDVKHFLSPGNVDKSL